MKICTYSDLARCAHAKGHARAIIWYGTLRVAGARPKAPTSELARGPRAAWHDRATRA